MTQTDQLDPIRAADPAISQQLFLKELGALIDLNIAWMHGEERHHEIKQVCSVDERVCVHTDGVHVYINGSAEETLAYLRRAYCGYAQRVKPNGQGWTLTLDDRV